MGRGLGLLAVLFSLNTVAATLTVPLEGVRAGVLDAKRENVFVVDKDDGLSVVSLTTGKVEAKIEGVTRALTLAASPREVVVVGESTQSETVLYRVDQATKQVTSLKLAGVSAPRSAQFIDGDRVLLMNDYKNETHVVSLKAGKVLGSLRPIQGLLYATPGIDIVDGNRALLPGAYPGEIAVVDVSAAPKLVESLPVRDWIHDVKLVEEGVAVTAGHLAGVSLVDLDAPDDEAKTKVLTKSRWAHLFVEKFVVHAVSVDKVERIDLPTGKVTVTALPKLEQTDFGRTALPLGRDKQNRLVILVESGGIIAL